ncbi:MAG: RIO1 family regulatory kinase/ATPase [Acidilobaceae archaeon]
MVRITYNLDFILSRLDNIDVLVLRAIEGLMGKFEFVPIEFIESRVRFSSSSLSKALHKLLDFRLISRRVGDYTGYGLTFKGLDTLAYHYLKSNGYVAMLGEKIGVGKEGEVFLGEAPSGEFIVVKFHRGGFSGFRRIRRFRSYSIDAQHSWLELAKLTGEREFRVLSDLYKIGCRVPKPIAWNRHAVVQEYIDGIDLYKVGSLDASIASKILDSIIEDIKIAYQKVRVVHGDLSEYNIMIVESSWDAYIIDWPQYAYRDDELAESLLRRDVEYILRFFKKKFGVSRDVESTIRIIKGEYS